LLPSPSATNSAQITIYPHSSERFTLSLAKNLWNKRTTRGRSAKLSGLILSRRRLLPATNDEVSLQYRNKNFHLGFEWPTAERAKFKKRISAENWPKDWFEQSSSGHKPWIFYLSDVFIEHCFDTIEAVMEALGGFYRERSLRKS
jgi:hypothetical protein